MHWIISVSFFFLSLSLSPVCVDIWNRILLCSPGCNSLQCWNYRFEPPCPIHFSLSSTPSCPFQDLCISRRLVLSGKASLNQSGHSVLLATMIGQVGLWTEVVQSEWISEELLLGNLAERVCSLLIVNGNMQHLELLPVLGQYGEWKPRRENSPEDQMVMMVVVMDRSHM